MRLNKQELEAIKKARDEVLGKETKVYLFGSRTDDSRKGGDIDLFVKKNIDIFEKGRFSWKIQEQIGEQKIDVLVDNKDNKHFINVVKNQFLKIC